MRYLLGFLCVGLIVASLAAGISRNNTHAAASVAKPAIQSTPEQIAKAAKCDKILKADKSGIWRHYDANSTGATVVIGPAFYASDFDTKAALNGLMRCDLTQGRMDDSVRVIVYEDWRTHKTVASWTPEMGLDVSAD